MHGWRVVAGLGSGSRQGKAVTSHARHRVTIYLPRRSLNTESPAGVRLAWGPCPPFAPHGQAQPRRERGRCPPPQTYCPAGGQTLAFPGTISPKTPARGKPVCGQGGSGRSRGSPEQLRGGPGQQAGWPGRPLGGPTGDRDGLGCGGTPDPNSGTHPPCRRG